MRTVLVNPRNKTTRTAKPRATLVVLRNGSPALPAMANPSPLMANPRRRRKTSGSRRPIVLMGNPRRRRRRANPAPLIMPNPRHRRARRNPGFSLMGGLKTGGMAMLAAAGSFAANKYLIANIGHNDAEHWNSPSNRTGVLIRTAIRFGVAAMASFVLPGTIGAGIGGAFCYPAIFELANWYQYRNAGIGAGAVDQATPLDPYRSPATLPDATATAGYEADLAADLDGYFRS
jgi:hypothetical protein